jgi:hypothetical protein
VLGCGVCVGAQHFFLLLLLVFFRKEELIVHVLLVFENEPAIIEYTTPEVFN